MKLKDHIEKKHNGSSTAFARAYTAILIGDAVIEPGKMVHRQQVDRWIEQGADWYKGRVQTTRIKP